MDETTVYTALQTLDAVPMRKGMEVFVVLEPNLGGRFSEPEPAKIEKATVLRVSDGQERSVLLRLHDGREKRWHPNANEIRSMGIYASLISATAGARLRNRQEVRRAEGDIEALRTRIARFKATCG
ncbi:MAG: hypothetical protein KIS92_20025 [Planctomycetota bacterium]|nr:hypothetical protein [Planctomycetota bacterium]